jgi:serine/threonine-protein kinase
VVAIPRFTPGDRVGNYEIVREVGAHGGGVVYEAAHRVLPRRATLKVMHGIVPALAVQIMREACILEALQHPGIVKVFESGVLADRRPWFALELVPGEPLSTVLARGALRAVETVTLVKELAEILEHAHRRGVIHHGLRPDRIVLSERRLCVVDWSEARAHDASNQIPHIPTPHARAYVAPEVARGDVTDDRADVYALGVIAYQALTGALPTPSAHIPAAQRCRNAPPELTTLIEQMLAPDRFDRPTAAEVRGELAWLASILEAAPAEHVELVDTDGVAEAPPPRLRKPRWTPPISYVASDLAVLVSGEIELD